MDNPILTMRAVGKRFPGVVALRGISLQVTRGEGHVLLGENGAGKSTLINLLAGVYSADDGEITFDGRPYRPRTPTDAFAPASASCIKKSRCSCR
jgi:ribose transport system ATP-binding protein